MDVFLILIIWKISRENPDKCRIFAFICSEMIVSLSFTLEKCMACYISIQKMSAIFIFWYFNLVSKRKIFKVDILHYLVSERIHRSILHKKICITCHIFKLYYFEIISTCWCPNLEVSHNQINCHLVIVFLF